MTLWLVRHAATADNIGGVLMGSRDVPAAPAELERAREVLSGVPLAAVFSSDAARAADTARAFAGEAPVVLDPRLRERSFGAWEGRRKADLPPEAFGPRGGVLLDYDPPGGETLDALLARVAGVLDDARAVEGDVAIVGHNGSLRALLILLGHEPEPFAHLAPRAV